MGNLRETAASGSRYDTLCELRDVLAESIELARLNEDTAHISAMVERMGKLVEEIETIEKTKRGKRQKTSIELARERAANVGKQAEI